MQLREWQQEAFDTLSEHDFNGVVKVASGKGKTVLALAVIKEILSKNAESQALVVVPTIALMEQWAKEVKKFVPEFSSSFYYGAKKDRRGRIIISVVNSSSRAEFDNIAIKVLDEVHHYGAELHQAIFSIPSLHTIGLSATPEREDEGDLAIRYGVGSMVYNLQNIDELKERFNMMHVRVPFTHVEYTEYQELQREYKQILFFSNIDVRKIPYQAKKGSKYALRILKLWSKQARLRHLARNKVPLIERILELEKGKKIIIFSESIEFSEEIGQKFGAVVVHSNLTKKIVLQRLEEFRQMEKGVLIAPRMIDEGYDVPDAQVAIVASFTRSPRQMIQRDGRLLRRHDYVRRYTLIIEHTEESKYFSILEKTNMRDVAFLGSWLRFEGKGGFIDDYGMKKQYKEHMAHESDYEDWIRRRMDYFHQINELNSDFYGKNKATVERLLVEESKRWPRFAKRAIVDEKQQAALIYTEEEQDELKKQLRKINSRLMLPDIFFATALRFIEGEEFVVNDELKHLVYELVKDDERGIWPEELYTCVKNLWEVLYNPEE